MENGYTIWKTKNNGYAAEEKAEICANQLNCQDCILTDCGARR